MGNLEDKFKYEFKEQDSLKGVDVDGIWTNVSASLDAQSSDKEDSKKDRRPFFYWSLAGLLLISALFYFIPSFDKTNTETKSTKSEQTASNNSRSNISSNQENETNNKTQKNGAVKTTRDEEQVVGKNEKKEYTQVANPVKNSGATTKNAIALESDAATQELTLQKQEAKTAFPDSDSVSSVEWDRTDSKNNNDAQAARSDNQQFESPPILQSDFDLAQDQDLADDRNENSNSPDLNSENESDPIDFASNPAKESDVSAAPSSAFEVKSTVPPADKEVVTASPELDSSSTPPLSAQEPNTESEVDSSFELDEFPVKSKTDEAASNQPLNPQVIPPVSGNLNNESDPVLQLDSDSKPATSTKAADLDAPAPDVDSGFDSDFAPDLESDSGSGFDPTLETDVNSDAKSNSDPVSPENPKQPEENKTSTKKKRSNQPIIPSIQLPEVMLKNWELDFSVNNNFWMSSYSGNTETTTFRQLLGESHKSKSSIGFSLHASMITRKNIRFGVGVEWQEYLETFNFYSETDSSVLRPNYQDEIPVIARRTVLHHNRLQFLSVPLEVGYQLNMGKLTLGAQAGLGLNYLLLQKGRSFNSEEEIVFFGGDESINIVDRKLFLSYQLRPFVDYAIGKRTSLRFHSSLRYQSLGESSLFENSYKGLSVGFGLGVVFDLGSE